ncbi:putative gluconokinase [Helianthus annuus]|nr:putative gluconokinase [Helianthus annuus]KAJ0878206.1 putative gluconokinase [Helianthus annuus]
MGVGGAGKSTIGELLAKALNCSFLDADDFHPQSNKEKMKKGIPLSDEDRTPWLEVLRDVVNANLVSGKTVILGCSALQKQYREILRSLLTIVQKKRFIADSPHVVTGLIGLTLLAILTALPTLFEVVDCRICGDPNLVIRFAFIEFTDEEGARNVLSLAGTMLGYYPVHKQF